MIMMWLAAAAIGPDETVLLAQTESPTQPQVEAAFLYHFGKFVDWPPSAFEGDRAPFRICVLGEDSFGGVLDQAMAGKKVGDRPIRVERMSSVTASSPCQILYVGPSQSARLSEVLKEIQGNHTLTVSDAPEFTDAGGMVAFVLVTNKVRFLINQDAANRAGLKISSQLLNLAMKVGER